MAPLTSRLSYVERAVLPSTPALTSYLLRLMALKSTNLCLSADVQTHAELLDLAEEVGPYIAVLKTHADIVRDFSERTIAALTALSRKHKFLIFEDRKFGDIGNTVQTQYAGGTFRIASWAYLVNAHLFPGPGVVQGLKKAAFAALASEKSHIVTEISGGGDISEELEHYIREEKQRRRQSGLPPLVGDSSEDSQASEDEDLASQHAMEGFGGEGRGRDGRPRAIRVGSQQRKGSVVSVSTTISSSAEYISPPATSTGSTFGSTVQTPSPTPMSRALPLPVAGDPEAGPPFARGLLLLAQMSSKDNLMTPEYAQRCYKLAREHKDFVLGFIAQESLNEAEGDNFLTMTPGIQLPPSETPVATPTAEDISGKRAMNGDHKGDTMGQQYNTPRHAILDKGVDVIIVGRGILSSTDRAMEAKRYRDEGWLAYMERIGNAASL